MQIAAIIGFTIACYGGGYICDVITARLIIRNHGIFSPEKRLISLAPGCLIAPAGCILLAFACQNQLHWAALAVGFGMGMLILRLNTSIYRKTQWPNECPIPVSFGTVYAPNIAMTYLLDCYPVFAQEILVAVNVVKNLVAFMFLYVAVDWVNSQGWIQVYMIMFMVVALSMLLAVPLYFLGAKARKSFEGTLVRIISPLDDISS